MQLRSVSDQCVDPYNFSQSSTSNSSDRGPQSRPKITDLAQSASFEDEKTEARVATLTW